MNKLLEELAPLSRWVCWIGKPVETRAGKKITKIPYYFNGRGELRQAATNKPETWGTYEQANKWAGRLDNSRKGIGFVLGLDLPYICIDLDHCLNDDGKLKDDEAGETAHCVLDILTNNNEDTYTEVSPSGDGLHIWGRAELPKGRKGIRGNHIEMYRAGRYMTVTGNSYCLPYPVKNIQKSVNEITQKFHLIEDSPAEGIGKKAVTPFPVLNLSDDETITKIRNSKSGPKFHSLYDLGDMSTYGDDQSRADQALLSILAFWTNGNVEQMKRIFLSSRLAETLRRKVRHEDDYLNRSIKKALEVTVKRYNGQAYSARKQAEEKLPFLENKQNQPIKCKDNLFILLKSKGVAIRKNIVTKSVDVNGKELEGLDYNAQAIKIRNMTKLGGLSLSKQDTNDFLDLIASENSYSPVCDYLMNCYKNYDGKDYITPLFNMFVLDTEIPQNRDFCKKLLIKWLLFCAIIPFNRKTMRRVATQQGVLTLVGGQGVGKTRFPLNTILKDLPEYLITGETIDPKDKDSVLRAIGCWVFEFSEFSESSTTKKQDALKSFIDRGKDKIRPPYAAKQIDEPRTCVFYATTNRTEFMQDPTGGRRWWPIAVSKINIDENFNAKQLWGQVMHLWKDEHEEPYLTEEETKELAKHNNNFSAKSDTELAICEYLDFGLPKEKWGWVSPAMLSKRLNELYTSRSYKPEATGLALTAMCRKNPAIEKRRTKKGYAYHIPFSPFGSKTDNPKK